MAQVQGEHIMHCWHYGGSTEGILLQYVSISFMVIYGVWWIMVLLCRSGYSQGEHNPLPLMTKGIMTLRNLGLPSSPKGEIVGSMVQV